MDPVARMLVSTPHFRGKRRLLRWWSGRQSGPRIRQFPGGLTMELDVRSDYEANIWLGLEERVELAALQSLLGPGDTFVDCGANLGLWTLAAAALVGERGTVVAFEPNPDTFRRLREHGLPCAGRIETHNTALSDRSGVVRFDPGRSHNVSQVTPEGTLEVPATTLDEALTRQPTGIKIDVEGQELAVLRCASRVLAARPWLVLEFNSDHAPSRRLGDWPVHAHLERLGYRASTFAGEQLGAGWRLRRDYTNLLYIAAD
jgi:FkbM family methyltransferase